MDKAELRLKVRAVLQEMPEEKRRLDSQKLRENLGAQPFFKEARSILFFAPLPDEPDLWPLLHQVLAAGKMVTLPCFDADNQTYAPRRVTDIHVEILTGQFGIREPATTCIAIPLDDLDLVLVPGAAFDLKGHRLGRGKGYYDRWLQSFTGKKIGIGFDEQVIELVPAQPYDVKMNWLVTPAKSINCEA